MARDRAPQRVLQYQQTLVSIAGQRDSFVSQNKFLLLFYLQMCLK